MILFRQLFYYLALLILVSIAACNGEQRFIHTGDHKIIVDSETNDPIIDLVIDDIHVKGTYYEKTVKATDYTNERKEFDKKLINALTEFGYSFANDIVVKNSYIVVAGPKYTAKLTSLIATYLPEFIRKSKASGPPVKDGFIGDALDIWKSITKDILVDEKKKSQLKIPADAQDFMKQLRQFMDTAQLIVANNPVGMYVDWRHLTMNDKTMAEFVAPLIVYLQENGYKKSITILDAMMGIVAKIKPSSGAA